VAGDECGVLGGVAGGGHCGVAGENDSECHVVKSTSMIRVFGLGISLF
jgi:hypothetical protein